MTVLWTVLAFIVAALGGWPLTAGILRLAKSRPVRDADAREQGTGEAPVAHAPPEPVADAQPEPATAPPAGPGVLRGGLLIGILERAAVVLAILAGQPVAIAYVVAVKGLGRYPELKQSPEVSERFIIGTMASLLWAAAVGAGAKVLLLG